MVPSIMVTHCKGMTPPAPSRAKKRDEGGTRPLRVLVIWRRGEIHAEVSLLGKPPTFWAVYVAQDLEFDFSSKHHVRGKDMVANTLLMQTQENKMMPQQLGFKVKLQSGCAFCSRSGPRDPGIRVLSGAPDFDSDPGPHPQVPISFGTENSHARCARQSSCRREPTYRPQRHRWTPEGRRAGAE